MSHAYSPNAEHIYIIAEMACSHEGDPAIARTIIDGAGQAGADAIQFQIWKLADLDVPYHPDYAERSQLELSQDEWASLADYSRGHYPDMQIIGCVYERGSVDFCERIEVDAYKLHSADLSNPYLVKYVAQTGRRIDLSVGASTLDEIQTAVQWIVEVSAAPIWMMYGFQNFPTNPEDIHLDYMMKLQDLFERPVGYQDHCDGDSPAGFWLPAAAAGMGIGILEKHITHDRSKKGIDYQAALNPDEFEQFVQMVRQIEAAKGNPVPHPFSPAEQVYRQYAKKSIVAGRDLPRGTVIGEDDLRFMRADKLGLPPDQAQRLLGRKLKRDIVRYALLREGDVE
jgi:N,N'-diacetyllegionaminate synthase